MIKVIILVLCITGSVLSQNACETKRLKDIKLGGWRGTNLGSWFVLEEWMAPSLWKENNVSVEKCQGSYLFEHCVGSAKAKEVMEKHWSTFVTEADFELMSKTGINIVRIPVGWWHIYDPQGGAAKAKLNYNITDKDYVVGGLAYLDKAFEWGEKHGIGIIIDIHGAPGSQNGNDNSSPYIFQERHWFTNPDNPKQTVDSLELYAERYASKDVLIGFDTINEPGRWDKVDDQELSVLKDFYPKAYAAIRKHTTDAWVLIMPYNYHDGREDTWAKFMNKDQGFTNVGMDLHFYSCLGGAGDKKNADDTIAYINKDLKSIIAQYNKVNPKPQVYGEWSGCMHGDQTKVADFIHAQLEVYNDTGLGNTFWSWTDQDVSSGSITDFNGDAWSMKVAIKKGWVTKLPTAC